jgi:hypothetical protein
MTGGCGVSNTIVSTPPLPDLLVLWITQKHIADGWRGSCMACPIALSASERLPAHFVSVAGNLITVSDLVTGTADWYALPQDAIDFMHAYDNSVMGTSPYRKRVRPRMLCCPLLRGRYIWRQLIYNVS